MPRKPKTITSSLYNLNELPSDRKFEELLYRIFEKRIETDLKSKFDLATLMPGVGEKGRDVLLNTKGKNTGLVQCKKSKNNFGKPETAKEIIKFVLYYIQDKSLVDDINTFNYYLAVSSQFSGPAIELLSNFNQLILIDSELEKWTNEIISKHEKLSGITFSSIRDEMLDILSKIIIKPIIYSDINKFLTLHESIVCEFFEIKKVIDNEGIKDIVSILSPDLEKQIPDFITSYYSSAKSILDIVKFIGYDVTVNRPQNIKVKDLYVEPLFAQHKIEKKIDFLEDEYQFKTINEIFQLSNHYIFLGDAGAGKSLTIKNLILRFINKETGDLNEAYYNYIPFRIELRKYNESRKKQSCNFIEYITQLLKSEYQLHEINDTLLNYIFKNYHSILFFDGLDEVFDVSDKTNIIDSIIAFLNNHPKMKGIITSRFLGYDKSTFSDELFTEFSIRNFNHQQINDFVDKFYKVQIVNKSDRETGSKDCKLQLRTMDEELKSNPLILSLMVLLAINHTIIPDSKLKVYQACTNTLVEKRDKEEKQLNIPLKIKNTQGTFGSLAFWRYCQLTNGGKSNQFFAINAIAEYLIERKEFHDIDDAKEAATHFLDYAEKRSIYFDDNFTHKTFLEYFTADFIFKKYHNTNKYSKRDEIIKNHIENTAWHIVFELLVAKIDEGVIDEEVLDNFVFTHLNNESPEINYFFLGLLNKIENLSDSTRKKIIKNSILLILAQKDIKQADELEKGLFFLFLKIISSNKVNDLIQLVINEIEEMLQTEEQIIMFYIFFYEINQRSIWRNIEAINITSKLLSRKIEYLKQKNINLFVYYPEDIPVLEIINKQIKYFGLHSPFQETRFIYQKNTSRISNFNIYIIYNDFSSFEQLKSDIFKLEKLGISLELIKEKIQINDFMLDFHSFVKNDESKNKLEKLGNIYVNNEDKKVNKFIEILIENFERDSNIFLRNHFSNYPKMINLLDKITFIDEEFGNNFI